MVASLNDPYSHYYDPSRLPGFLNEDNPHLSGIGVDVADRAAGTAWSSDVFPGSPAAKAGLQRGRRDHAVGSTSLANRPSNFRLALIKGRAGTRVTMTVQRGHRTRIVHDRPGRHHGAGREQADRHLPRDTSSATCS